MRLFFVATVVASVLATGAQANTGFASKCKNLLAQINQLEAFHQLLEVHVTTVGRVLPLLDSKIDKCMLQKGVDIKHGTDTQQPYHLETDSNHNHTAEVLDDDACEVYYAFYMGQGMHMASFGSVMKTALQGINGKIDTLCEVCPCYTKKTKDAVTEFSTMMKDLQAAVDGLDSLSKSFIETFSASDTLARDGWNGWYC